MEHSITKTVDGVSITQYMYTVGEITLFGFEIMEIPLKQYELPIWFLNFMDKKEVFMTLDGDTILISGMENNCKQVIEISSTSTEDLIYNRLIIGDYIVYDPRFDDVYATNSDGFIDVLKTITEYTFELDTCPEDASSLDDMRNGMKLEVLSSDANSDPGTITAGVLKTKKDNINPNHYKFGDMEAMPFIDAVTEFGEFKPVETPHVKDAIKYLVRYPRKNGLEDLKKAQWFINHLIEVREKIENSVGNQYGSSIIKLNANESMKFIELLNADLDDIDNSIITFTNDSEVKYSGHGLAYVEALVKNGIIYTNNGWTKKKIKTLSGDLFINAGDSLRYFDDEIYFYNQEGAHRL